MIINRPLRDIVLSELARQVINADDIFRLMCDGRAEEGVKLLEKGIYTSINKTDRCMIHYDHFTGHGYDFTQVDEETGVATKELYERHLKNANEMDSEILVASGIRKWYGWYITLVVGEGAGVH